MGTNEDNTSVNLLSRGENNVHLLMTCCVVNSALNLITKDMHGWVWFVLEWVIFTGVTLYAGGVRNIHVLLYIELQQVNVSLIDFFHCFRLLDKAVFFPPDPTCWPHLYKEELRIRYNFLNAT
jgi:hypothetical protein